MASWHSFLGGSGIVTACAGLALGRVSRRRQSNLAGACVALRRVQPLSGPAGGRKPPSWVRGMSLAPCSSASRGSVGRATLGAAASLLGIELHPTSEGVCDFCLLFCFVFPLPSQVCLLCLCLSRSRGCWTIRMLFCRSSRELCDI